MAAEVCIKNIDNYRGVSTEDVHPTHPAASLHNCAHNCTFACVCPCPHLQKRQSNRFVLRSQHAGPLKTPQPANDSASTGSRTENGTMCVPASKLWPHARLYAECAHSLRTHLRLLRCTRVCASHTRVCVHPPRLKATPLFTEAQQSRWGGRTLPLPSLQRHRQPSRPVCSCQPSA